ncbi:O-antigen ligase family protein, partial [Candidatus Falkowbacteria bacterium]|nr:O-antigen ligase family protein [Candidatus Falkowbacteria bacterium]
TVWQYWTRAIYATEILLGLVIILGIVFVGGRIKAKKQESKKATNKRNVVIAIFIILGFLGNALLAYNVELALYKLTYLILAVALTFLFIVIKPNFLKISWAVVLAGLIQSAFAINQFIAQRVIGDTYLGMADQTTETLGAPVILLSDGTRWLRSFGTLPHPNILAGFLLISLFFIIGLIVLTKNKKHQKLLPLIFVVNFIGLITTASRAAIVAFAIGIILLSFFAAKDKILTKQTTKFVFISIFILILFAVSFPELIKSRLDNNNRLEQISSSSRVEQYQEFGQVIKSNFIVGVGLGNYTYYQQLQNPELSGYQLQPIHNSFLLIIAELGIIGVATVLAFLYYLFYSIKNFKKWETNQIITFSAIIALTITATLDHYLWDFWFGMSLLAIILAISFIKNNQE